MTDSHIEKLFSAFKQTTTLTFPQRKGASDENNPFEAYYYREDAEKVKLDKWPHYLEIYEEVFAKFRNKEKVRILEIGVHHGGSLHMLKQSFPDAYIVGVDIKPECKACEVPEDDIYVEIGDQGAVSFLEDVVSKHGQFDIVIDDGSHIASHQKISFLYLFLNGLSDNGVYLVEDVFVNYMKAFNDTNPNFMEMAYDLARELQSPYKGEFVPARFRVDNEDKYQSLDVSIAYKNIHSISFFDNIVTISKKVRDGLPCMEYR